jgi:DNA-binding transcriptional LysR family regulator
MSAAARQLGSTPSAVSQRVRALEALHGVRLLHRSTRKITLTEAGARLREHAQAMLSSAEAAREALARSRDALEGALRLSAPVGFARHVAPALSPLLAAHPQLHLHLVVDDAMIDLIDHRIDIALRAGTLGDSAWVARRLCAFEWAICAAPAYVARAGMPAGPEALAEHVWLSVREGTLRLPLVGPGGAERPLVVTPRITSNNQLTLAQLCAAGLGLTMQVRPDVEDDLRAGRLVEVLPSWRLAPIPVWAVTPRRASAQPAKVRHAIAALQAWLRTRPGVVD